MRFQLFGLVDIRFHRPQKQREADPGPSDQYLRDNPRMRCNVSERLAKPRPLVEFRRMGAHLVHRDSVSLNAKLSTFAESSTYAGHASRTRYHLHHAMMGRNEPPVVLVGEYHGTGSAVVKLAAALGVCRNLPGRTLAMELPDTKVQELVTTCAMLQPLFEQCVRRKTAFPDSFAKQWTDPKKHAAMLQIMTALHLGYKVMGYDDLHVNASSIEARDTDAFKKLDASLKKAPGALVVHGGAHHLHGIWKHMQGQRGFNTIAIAELSEQTSSVREHVEDASFVIGTPEIAKNQAQEELRKRFPTGADIDNAIHAGADPIAPPSGAVPTALPMGIPSSSR